ncbi:ABC transporter ATP-binding protein [Anaerocolumna sp. AGMB13025]|uniref:ABC transporter ATP-binding protein n=1 Tax=Anaerocolumna sp. AGMB13025 TaxID=3039116 RepID=UPI00241D7878|nr:ABC transporter ATP-binding protein [Anaerocolumna sp. AGMB13025]WFR57013.1 ABC transporter ATP-binding protein [Anaerocolumna sp. AGMB13025]
MIKQENKKILLAFDGIKYFFEYCWKCDKKYIIYLFLGQILTSFTTIIGIILPKYIINAIFIQKNYINSIKFIVFQIIITFITMIIINIITNKCMVRRMLIFKKFQIYLNELMMKVEYNKLESNDFLEIRNKAYKYLYSDGNGFAQLLEESIKILGSFIILISIIGIIGHLKLYFILVLLVTIVFNIFCDSYYKKKNIDLALKKSIYERRSSYFTNISSDFRYGKEIRTFNLSKWLLNKYDTVLEEMQGIYKEVAKNNITYSSTSVIINVIQQGIMYAYILFYVIYKNITVGDFSMYLNAITQFISIVRSILKSLVDLQQYTIYYNSFEEFINLTEATNNEGKLKPDINNGFMFEFRNVSYRYTQQNEFALKNVSISFKSTDKVAIVGENGSGKSTFIKLLLRIYTPTDGIILLNGININDIDYDFYLSMISAVFQDYKLYSMPFMDNIILNSEPVDMDKLYSILTECKLDKKISVLPDGINTYIYNEFSSTGFEPSGGEAQKIAIARTLYRDSRIVILDEPTSALDAKTEYEIYSQFNRFYNNKLFIFISHRMAVTRFSDIILTFYNGTIVESGTHEDLIKLKGVYSDLYDKQADLYQ